MHQSAEGAPARVAFYTRKGCTLCVEPLALARQWCAELGLSLVVRDLEASAAWQEAYGWHIPVVEIDGRARLRGVISPAWLRRELCGAARRYRPPAVNVSVVLVFDGDRVLINQRPEGSFYGGWWEWPGGKQEPGETMLECARRELMEEIGIRGSQWRPWRAFRARFPQHAVTLHFFTCRLARHHGIAESPAAGALRYQWLKPEEIAETVRFLEPNLPVLRQLIQQRPWQQPPARHNALAT